MTPEMALYMLILKLKFFDYFAALHICTTFFSGIKQIPGLLVDTEHE